MNTPFNGDRLRKARIYRGLTVAELAERVGCQRQTLSMYEISFLTFERFFHNIYTKQTAHMVCKYTQNQFICFILYVFVEHECFSQNLSEIVY